MKYAITGKFPVTRKELIEVIGDQAEFTTALSEATHVLVGDKPGDAKMAKIFKYKLKVMYVEDVIEEFGPLVIDKGLCTSLRKFVNEYDKDRDEDDNLWSLLGHDEDDEDIDVWKQHYKNNDPSIRVMQLEEDFFSLRGAKIEILDMIQADDMYTYVIFREL